MNSSINCVARFFGSRSRSEIASPEKTAFGSIVSRLSAPWQWRRFHEPLCDAVLEAEVFGETPDLHDPRGSCAFAIQPRRDASVSQFPVISDARPV
jgi:hypothetical protein